eukprot:7230385-Pyramimonas_sp.AAC.1
MAAASIRWVRGRHIHSIEPPAFITLHIAWLSSINVHFTSRYTTISHNSKAGSNSMRKQGQICCNHFCLKRAMGHKFDDEKPYSG